MKNKTSNRVEWIDFAKGITILLTIVGHTVMYNKAGSMARGIIFSFHMPLFFILSMVTFKCSDNIDIFKYKTKNAARHLLMPALITYLLTVCIGLIRNPVSLDGNFWRGKLYTLIFASGVETTYYDQYVPLMGIQWFFFALFIGRTIFDYVHLNNNDVKDANNLLVITVILGLLGIIVGQMAYLPFSLDIALAIMPFFYFGYKLKKVDILHASLKKMLIAFGVWVISLYILFPNTDNWTYLELATRRYPMFPLCYICAMAGTMFVSELSVFGCKVPILSRCMQFIGKNSLWMLCVHIMDGYFSQYWVVVDNQTKSSARRIVADVIVFLMVMLVRTVLIEIKTKIIRIKK